MGSESGEDNEKPVHQVKLSNFYISKTEVTNAQYAQFLNEYQSEQIKTGNKFADAKMIYEYEYKWGVQFVENPQGFKNLAGLTGLWQPAAGYENHPVINVTWFGAYEFCRWYGYQLPSEAQWEYAARGVNYQNLPDFKNLADLKYAGSNNIDSVAWYSGNSYNLGSSDPNYGTHQTATKAPNQLGLYDMSGNVYEWCMDWYKSDLYKDCTNDTKLMENPLYNPESSSNRVLRGGSWDNSTTYCRVVPTK